MCWALEIQRCLSYSLVERQTETSSQSTSLYGRCASGKAKRSGNSRSDITIPDFTEEVPPELIPEQGEESCLREEGGRLVQWSSMLTGVEASRWSRRAWCMERSCCEVESSVLVIGWLDMRTGVGGGWKGKELRPNEPTSVRDKVDRWRLCSLLLYHRQQRQVWQWFSLPSWKKKSCGVFR